MLEILCKNLKIFIIKYIYKINKYKILLLIICEIIFLDTTFIVDFVFLNKKIKSYYDEVLYYLI